MLGLFFNRRPCQASLRFDWPFFPYGACIVSLDVSESGLGCGFDIFLIGGRMKIDIERLGLKNVTIDPETLFDFPVGLFGFEDCKRYKIFHEEGQNTVCWLQSVDDTDVMFPIVAPEALDIEYQIELSDEECALIGMQSVADVAVVVIVYRDEAQGGRIAANARSPIILNLKDRKGMQKILRDVHHTLLHRAR